MSTCWLLVLALLAAMHGVGRGGNVPEEERLMKDLFLDYNSSTRPVLSSNDTVLVYIGVALLKLIDLDEREQTMKSVGWMTAEWTDPRLRWDPADYGGLTVLTLPPTIQPWLPRFVIINTVAEVMYTSEYFSMFGVKVTPEGKVRWQPGGYFVTQCDVDMTYYPFDSQTCDIIYSNWIYTGPQVNLTFEGDPEEYLTNAYTPSGSWDLEGVRVTRVDEYYIGSPDPYPLVTFRLFLRRKYLYYWTNMLIPAILMSILVLYVFRLPPEAGEKISLSTTLLLSFVVLLMMIAEQIPSTSLSVPLIQVYLLLLLVSTSVVIIISIYNLRMYHSAYSNPPPAWLRRLCLVDPLDKPAMGLSQPTGRPPQVSLLRVYENGGFQPDSPSKVPTYKYDQTSDSPVQNECVQRLNRIITMMECKEQRRLEQKARDEIQQQWRDIASRFDRFFFYCFVAVLVTKTIIIFVVIPSMMQ